MQHALIVDDEPAICRCFEALLAEHDCRTTSVATAEEAISIAATDPIDLVILDIRLPGMDGLSAMKQLQRHSDGPVIVMTAHGDLQTAVTAVQSGAFEYIPKPFELDQISGVVESALKHRTNHPSSTEQPGQGMKIVGQSLPMQRLFRQIAMSAQQTAPVLITGESGTGKELVANAIHQNSQRSTANLVAVNVAAIHEGLLERELFGHTVGAFTGATVSQPGLIEQADSGCLFLDEVGEASAPVQLRLLRAVETGEFLPVGSSEPKRSDFRLITATNRSIDYLKTSEAFRSDLFFRLATTHIEVPPLRDRLEDVPELVSHFLVEIGQPDREFHADAIELLQSYRFPGNVRELRNIVFQAVGMTNAGTIGPKEIRGLIQDEHDSVSEEVDPMTLLEEALSKASGHFLSGEYEQPLQEVTSRIEQQMIALALKRCDGNRSAAARLLGIHRETLRERLSKPKQS